MTKGSLARNIVSIVQNGTFTGDSDKEVTANMEALLDTLEPKDRETFSRWGFPDGISTSEDCW